MEYTANEPNYHEINKPCTTGNSSLSVQSSLYRPAPSYIDCNIIFLVRKDKRFTEEQMDEISGLRQIQGEDFDEDDYRDDNHVYEYDYICLNVMDVKLRFKEGDFTIVYNSETSLWYTLKIKFEDFNRICDSVLGTTTKRFTDYL